MGSLNLKPRITRRHRFWLGQPFFFFIFVIQKSTQTLLIGIKSSIFRMWCECITEKWLWITITWHQYSISMQTKRVLKEYQKTFKNVHIEECESYIQVFKLSLLFKSRLVPRLKSATTKSIIWTACILIVVSIHSRLIFQIPSLKHTTIVLLSTYCTSLMFVIACVFYSSCVSLFTDPVLSGQGDKTVRQWVIKE